MSRKWPRQSKDYIPQIPREKTIGKQWLAVRLDETPEIAIDPIGISLGHRPRQTAGVGIREPTLAPSRLHMEPASPVLDSLAVAQRTAMGMMTTTTTAMNLSKMAAPHRSQSQPEPWSTVPSPSNYDNSPCHTQSTSKHVAQGEKALGVVLPLERSPQPDPRSFFHLPMAKNPSTHPPNLVPIYW
eukprot:CAMPEP_0184689468 /NCGR_PEP_ID=MMETSP0312-20130426/30674_1 /TAXON_ID=31354 /ORGANISM="Compsopogon coeruleus, Strain SAG 36.94" /LENGTH=184 /DNA_ID=CAMNT_0027146821 /DNA_START=888 /DNA_END=1439 /DNA_ORIENTATION=-